MVCITGKIYLFCRDIRKIYCDLFPAKRISAINPILFCRCVFLNKEISCIQILVQCRRLYQDDKKVNSHCDLLETVFVQRRKIFSFSFYVTIGIH